MDPSVGGSRSLINFNNVDFPMPLGPMMQPMSPSHNWNLAWTKYAAATEPLKSKSRMTDEGVVDCCGDDATRHSCVFWSADACDASNGSFLVVPATALSVLVLLDCHRFFHASTLQHCATFINDCFVNLCEASRPRSSNIDL